jgi:hypothetical protein
MPADTPRSWFSPEPDPRSGLSLSRNGCASQRLHPGVNVPGLPLQVPARLPPGPFGPSAPQPRLVRPSRCCFYASDPLPDLHQSALTLPDASTPLQDSYVPPDQRVQRRSSSRTRSPVTPDSPSLPVAVVFWITGCGSSFRGRYVLLVVPFRVFGVAARPTVVTAAGRPLMESGARSEYATR